MVIAAGETACEAWVLYRAAPQCYYPNSPPSHPVTPAQVPGDYLQMYTKIQQWARRGRDVAEPTGVADDDAALATKNTGEVPLAWHPGIASCDHVSPDALCRGGPRPALG